VAENVEASGVEIPADSMTRIEELLGDLSEKDPAKTEESSPKTRET